jgi:hypothetical protein
MALRRLHRTLVDFTTRPWCAGLLLALAVACDTSTPPPLDVRANQPPIAHIALPDAIEARSTVLVDSSGSHDLDGEIVAYTFFIDGVAVDGVAPQAHLRFEEDGEQVVSVLVTDDEGETGRASVRVVIAPARDADGPVIGTLVLRYVDDDAPIAPHAALLGGSVIELEVTAEDVASSVDTLHIEVSTGVLDDVALGTASVRRTTTARLHLSDIDTLLSIDVKAIDGVGNRSERSFAWQVWSSETDSDGDGIPDALDPAPTEANGVVVEVFALDSFPRDLFGNQMAERIVDAVLDGAPLQTITLPMALLAGVSEDGTPHGLGLVDGMPVLEQNWALRIRGRLRAPPGFPMLSVAIAADDVGVVLVEGAPLASADAEFATNFFRTNTLASTAGPIFFGSAPVAYDLIVANESGPFAFDLGLTFAGPGETVITDDELTLAAFLLPE